MRIVKTIVATASLAVLAAPLHAQTLDLSWDQCAPVVAQKSGVAGPATVYASVTGQTEGHKAYQVWLVIGDANDQVPDAWRFETCMAGGATLSESPSASLAKSCPPFVPAATRRLVISAYAMMNENFPYPLTLARAVMAVAYPDGVASPDPGARYHLARYTFDLTGAVEGKSQPGESCGGLETPMTIRVMPGYATWIATSGGPADGYPFQDGNVELRFETVPAGGAVPAVASSWGQIKGQYRR
jgi:hypothetical protein